MKSLLIILASAISFGIVRAGVLDVPTLNAQIPIVPSGPGQKRWPKEFNHPGLWHSHDELEMMRNKVLAGTNPWASTYDRFKADNYSQADWRPRGPAAVYSRGTPSNATAFIQDGRAAYQNAIMWYITKDQRHYNASTALLDAYGRDLTALIGTDRSLLVGLDGSEWTNAAEIMRWEGGWKDPNSFSAIIYWLFMRQSIIVGQANYGFASIKGLLDFAVYLDDVTAWNYAMYMALNDPCAGIDANFQRKTGQSSEAGRDQGHVQVALGWTALASRTAKNQGYDLFAHSDFLLSLGAEHAAKYNMNETVPYDPTFFRCEAVLVKGPWTNISSNQRGITPDRAVWDILYYTGKARGRDVTWVTKAKNVSDAMGGEGTPTKSINDMPGWGDLLWAQ